MRGAASVWQEEGLEVVTQPCDCYAHRTVPSKTVRMASFRCILPQLEKLLSPHFNRGRSLLLYFNAWLRVSCARKYRSVKRSFRSVCGVIRVTDCPSNCPSSEHLLCVTLASRVSECPQPTCPDPGAQRSPPRDVPESSAVFAECYGTWCVCVHLSGKRIHSCHPTF